MQQIKPLSLRRNFSWTFIGNSVYAACQWGMLVVLAKLGSPEMVGQFTLGLAVTAPIIMFTNLQLRVVQATDSTKEYSFSEYLALRLIGTGVAMVVIIAISLSNIYSDVTSLVIFLVGLAKVFESISDVFYGLFQQYEQMNRIAISLMIKGPLSIIPLGIGVYISGNIIWGVIALIMSWVIILLCYDVPIGIEVMENSQATRVNKQKTLDEIVNLLQPKWHFKILKKLLLLALPLGFVMMLISLNVNIPRYFIENYLSERELGIFAAISYLTIAGGMVVSALAESAIPRLSQYYSSANRNAFCMLLFKLALVGSLIGGSGILVGLLFGKQFLTILYSPEYALHTDVFLLLMIAAAINYTFAFLGYGRTAARYFIIQVPLSFLVTSSSAVACFWLIPNYGLYGAATALIIAAIVEAGSNFGVILHALHKISRPLNY